MEIIAPKPIKKEHPLYPFGPLTVDNLEQYKPFVAALPESERVLWLCELIDGHADYQLTPYLSILKPHKELLQQVTEKKVPEYTSDFRKVTYSLSLWKTYHHPYTSAAGYMPTSEGVHALDVTIFVHKDKLQNGEAKMLIKQIVEKYAPGERLDRIHDGYDRISQSHELQYGTVQGFFIPNTNDFVAL